MNCQTAQEHFSDYISRDLDRAMTLSVENHLQTCERCREEVAALRQTWDSLSELPRVELPLYFHENLMGRIAVEEAQAEEQSAARRALWDWRALFRPRSLAYGAAALVLLLTLTQVVPGVRAVLDPIGWVVQLFRPASPPPAPAVQADWSPAPQGRLSTGGTLTVRLQPAKETPNSGLKYTLSVPGEATARTGFLSATRETVEAFTLTNAPASVTLTFGEDTTPKNIPVTQPSAAVQP